MTAPEQHRISRPVAVHLLSAEIEDTQAAHPQFCDICKVRQVSPYGRVQLRCDQCVAVAGVVEIRHRGSLPAADMLETLVQPELLSLTCQLRWSRRVGSERLNFDALLDANDGEIKPV